MMQTNVRRFEAFKKGERRPFKPKAWNHQDDLKGHIGRLIKLMAVANHEWSIVQGELLNADQFTLQIRSSYDNSIQTYFKHSIARYEFI